MKREDIHIVALDLITWKEAQKFDGKMSQVPDDDEESGIQTKNAWVQCD